MYNTVIKNFFRLDFEQWWFCKSGYQIVSYFAICHAWERQKHNLSFNVHCSKTIRWIYLIIGMTNCHILGFNIPFTESNYLIGFLCKLRLNTDDRTLDTRYMYYMFLKEKKLRCYKTNSCNIIYVFYRVSIWHFSSFMLGTWSLYWMRSYIGHLRDPFLLAQRFCSYKHLQR